MQSINHTTQCGCIILNKLTVVDSERGIDMRIPNHRSLIFLSVIHLFLRGNYASMDCGHCTDTVPLPNSTGMLETRSLSNIPGLNTHAHMYARVCVCIDSNIFLSQILSIKKKSSNCLLNYTCQEHHPSSL